MQAIMVSEPGGPEVLRVGETDIPRPDRGEVLVRVLAAGVGPGTPTCAAAGGAAPGRTSPVPSSPDWSRVTAVTRPDSTTASRSTATPAVPRPGWPALARRYYWQDAAAAHREIEKGHTRGKLVLIVDEDLAATMEL